MLVIWIVLLALWLWVSTTATTTPGYLRGMMVVVVVMMMRMVMMMKRPTVSKCITCASSHALETATTQAKDRF